MRDVKRGEVFKSLQVRAAQRISREKACAQGAFSFVDLCFVYLSVTETEADCGLQPWMNL